MANTFTALTGGGAGNAYQAGDEFGFETVEKIRQNFDALAEMGCILPLQAGPGSTRNNAWADVPWAMDYDLNADDLGGLTVDITYYSWTTDASGSVQLRLRNATDGTTIDTSTAVTSTTRQRETKTVTLTAGGSRRYSLQIQGGDANIDIIGYAYLRIRKT